MKLLVWVWWNISRWGVWRVYVFLVYHKWSKVEMLPFHRTHWAARYGPPWAVEAPPGARTPAASGVTLITPMWASGTRPSRKLLSLPRARATLRKTRETLPSGTVTDLHWRTLSDLSVKSHTRLSVCMHAGGKAVEFPVFKTYKCCDMRPSCFLYVRMVCVSHTWEVPTSLTSAVT